jgi:dihydrofolate reductase
MSRLIVTEFITLDGVVEAPGGEPTHPHSGWVGDFMGDEQMQYKLQETRDAGALLIGRVTYDGFSQAWPGRDGEFADKMNGMPKYVVSTTLAAPLAWNNSTVINGDVAGEIEKLKQADGDPILVAGSATLVPFLLEHNLVDELRLMVFPVLVGGGKRCFPESLQKHSFRVVDSRLFATGVAVHTYEPSTA